MGLVKTRRLAAMQKQQRAKVGMQPPIRKDILRSLPPRPGESDGCGMQNDIGHLANGPMLIRL